MSERFRSHLVDDYEVRSLLKHNADRFVLEVRADVEAEIAEWEEWERETNPDDRQYPKLGEHVRLGLRIMCITPYQLSNILFECFGDCSQLKYATLAKILANCDEIAKFPYVFQAKDFIRIWNKDFPILTDPDIRLGTSWENQAEVERRNKVKIGIIQQLGYNWDYRDLQEVRSYQFWDDLLVAKGLQDWDWDYYYR